jgi:AcrR family transcriptional regulator
MKKARARSRKPSEAATSRTLTRERILNAAFSAFMEKGYAGASTLEIATRAKVSKRELYEICSDKPALLKDAIMERAQRMRLPLDLPRPKDRSGLARLLTMFGTGILRGVSEPAVRGVYRLAIAESPHAPEIAQLLDSVARQAARAALGRTLAQAQADRLIGSGDPATMAVDFFALLWGDLLLQLLLRVVDPPSPEALERKAQVATEKFLKLYQRRRSL